ncbi:MAG: glycosyltransferase family 4 protein [Candidatus Rokuibacteriota bacterium]
MADRKVLLVSYHFPPDLAVGALRPAKTAKYLAQLGWQPYVLTVKDRYHRHRDDGRLADVDGIPVIRTAVWPTVSQLVLGIRNVVRGWWRRRPDAPRAAAGRTNGARSREPARREGLLQTLRRYVDSLLELPDKQIGWLPPAVWTGYRVIRREGIGLIITSSPPATTALVGLALSWLADAKLVTDLRDPWYSPLGRPAHSSSALSDALQRGLERRIMKRSSRVVTTTEHYRQFLAATYPELPPDRLCTIWNGYDPEVFETLEPATDRDGTFTIAYVGTFYHGRTPKEVLRAAAELVEEGAVGLADLRISLIGDVRYAEGESVEELARAHGLAGSVAIQGPVPHRVALQHMKEADVLLLLAPDQYYCVPAKTFEYLAAGRPILCVAREGATAALIRQTGAGVVVEPGDVAGVKHALRRWLLEHRNGDRREQVADLSRYERRRLAQDLARVLETCLQN